MQTVGQNLLEEIKRLREENAKLKSRGVKELSFKVAEKGGLSVYGLGRFPVTLYRSQWERLFARLDDMRAFMAANSDLLKEKE